MDPSAQKGLIKNSFTLIPSTPVKDIKLLSYYSNPDSSPRAVRRTCRKTKPNPIVKEYNVLNHKVLKKMYSIKIEDYNDVLDPFSTVDSMFKNRGSIVMSNIDGVFNLTGQELGYIIKQNIKDFTFVSIEKDSGVAEYLQYRLPISTGFVETSSKDLNMRRLNMFDKVESVRDLYSVGVDLVVSKDTNDFKSNLNNGLKLVKPGGSFVSEVNLNKLENRTLLYITSLCFKKITLFKPISTNLNDNIHYIVAEESYGNNIKWSSYLSNEFELCIPDSFINWVYNYQILFLKHKEYIYNIINNTQKNTSLYNKYKCLATWNIQ